MFYGLWHDSQFVICTLDGPIDRIGVKTNPGPKGESKQNNLLSFSPEREECLRFFYYDDDIELLHL